MLFVFCVLSEDFLYRFSHFYPTNNRGANNKSVLSEDSYKFILYDTPFKV